MPKKENTTKTTKPKKQSTKKTSVTKSNKQVKDLRQDLALEKEKYLRLFAEFENFKKRTAKERLDLFKTANQEVIQALIPVLDDFNRANQQMKKEKGTIDQKGIFLVYNKFLEVLKTNGLTQTEVKIGDTFDADLHEAITQISTPGEDDKGKVIDIVEVCYQLGDRIIRYPKVVVGQ